MTQLERLYQLNSFLLNEMPQYKKQALSFGKDEKNQFQLFRSLVNVRPPMPASFQFLKIQDEYLQAELRSKGITDMESLTAITEDLYLWQGDITTLKCGAVVNAANSQMLGPYSPFFSSSTFISIFPTNSLILGIKLTTPIEPVKLPLSANIFFASARCV